jgi:hypothetical protein
MILGPGLQAVGDGGAMVPGLNLMWVNATLGVRAVQSGPTAILSTLHDLISPSAPLALVSASPSQHIANQWNVVWVEDVADPDGGTHQVMRMNELVCN